MGIDPGSHYTGYAFLLYEKGEFLHKGHGVIAIPKKLDFYKKLHFLQTELHSLFRKHKPQETVVEKIFFGKNADSAFKLGHIRGICLQKAAEWDSEVYEYSSSKMKKTVTGRGNVSKAELRQTVFYLLQLESQERDDASDALALAFCHSRHKETLEWIKNQTGGSQQEPWV